MFAAGATLQLNPDELQCQRDFIAMKKPNQNREDAIALPRQMATGENFWRTPRLLAKRADVGQRAIVCPYAHRKDVRVR